MQALGRWRACLRWGIGDSMRGKQVSTEEHVLIQKSSAPEQDLDGNIRCWTKGAAP